SETADRGSASRREGDVAFRDAEDAAVPREEQQRGPAPSEGSHRIRKGPAGHRPNVSAERDRRRDALSGRGTRSRQSRHHRVVRKRRLIMDWKLELVPIPVADVERAKDFY